MLIDSFALILNDNLLANSQFCALIIKMWLGGTPDVVVRALKISLD